MQWMKVCVQSAAEKAVDSKDVGAIEWTTGLSKLHHSVLIPFQFSAPNKVPRPAFSCYSRQCKTNPKNRSQRRGAFELEEKELGP